jgi:hypothetical protein
MAAERAIGSFDEGRVPAVVPVSKEPSFWQERMTRAESATNERSLMKRVVIVAVVLVAVNYTFLIIGNTLIINFLF